LTLAEIDLYLYRRTKAGGVVSTVWTAENPTEEIGGGLYSKSYASDDPALYQYFGFAQYTGVTVLDTNFALYAGSDTPDAQEARDAMKLAPTAGAPAVGSVDKHLDDIQASTDTIGALTVTVTAPVAADGTITVIRGDDYLLADGRELSFVGTTWPVITGGAIALIVRFSTVASYAGVITGAAACYVELTDTQTALMTPSVYD
jgi:hypothetical protein